MSHPLPEVLLPYTEILDNIDAGVALYDRKGNHGSTSCSCSRYSKWNKCRYRSYTWGCSKMQCDDYI